MTLQQHPGPAATEGGEGAVITGRWGGAPGWFATADAVGDEVVPRLADWCAVHVRVSAVRALRAGVTVALDEIVAAQPDDGELLEMITLRHRDAGREPVVRHWAAEVPVRVGDNYGAGRVAATGVTRYLPHVPSGMLQAVVTDPEQASQLRSLGVSSSIVVPLRTSSGVLLGAMTLIRELDFHEPFAESDVHTAEGFARLAADALDASRVTTVTTESATPPPWLRDSVSWRPENPAAVTTSTEGRNWVRMTLPEVLTRTPRREFYDDVDLVATELISNAVRHGGGLCEAQLINTGEHLRVVAADDDPRSPAVRPRHEDRPNGRGMHLIQALTDAWGVYRHHAEPGKRVWADLRFS
ncbi:ATP-binding protein [Actinoplanes sp. NPDC020271]|uniref:ATP-binding protein n=1 Tax=Actinoplanes sp. NPDC020271 TaxID=3363896 RepID=UPI00378CBA97